MDSNRRILSDGAIAIRNGRIIAIDPYRDIAPSIEATTERNLNGALVHPGFVNAHVHVEMQRSKGLLQVSTIGSYVYICDILGNRKVS